MGNLYNCTARPRATLLQPFLGQAPTQDQPSPRPRPAQPPPQTSPAPTPDQPSSHPRPAQPPPQTSPAPTPDQPSSHPRPAQPPPQTSPAPTQDQPSPHPRPAQLQVRRISHLTYNGRCDHIQTKENVNASYTLVRTIWSENPMAEPSVNPMPLERIPLQRQTSKHWSFLHVAFATEDTLLYCRHANVISHSRPCGHP